MVGFWDKTCCTRKRRMGNTCEQGDPLSPALFALVGAASSPQPNEELAALLDDVYPPGRQEHGMRWTWLLGPLHRTAASPPI